MDDLRPTDTGTGWWNYLEGQNLVAGLQAVHRKDTLPSFGSHLDSCPQYAVAYSDRRGAYRLGDGEPRDDTGPERTKSRFNVILTAGKVGALACSACPPCLLPSRTVGVFRASFVDVLHFGLKKGGGQKVLQHTPVSPTHPYRRSLDRTRLTQIQMNNEMHLDVRHLKTSL